MPERFPARTVSLLGAIALGGVSLLVPPLPDLWEALTVPVAWATPGALGFFLWQWAHDAFGMAGPALIRFLCVALITHPLLSKNGGGSFAKIACGLSFALLVPWGPGLLFFPMLAAGSGLAARRLVWCVGLLVVWPFLDGSYWLGSALLALGVGALPLRQSWGLALAPLVNPVGFWGVVTGRAFLPFVAVAADHPGFAFSSPLTPTFLLSAIWGVVAVTSTWGSWRLRTLGLVAASLGVALRPAAALPALVGTLAPQGGPSRGWPTLLTLPLAAWMLLGPRSAGVPPTALQDLQSLPAGNWTVQADISWSALLALRLGPEHVSPRFDNSSLLAFRTKYPEGMAAPFPGWPASDADLVLMAPCYPTTPFRQLLAPGWYLVAATPHYALFARQTPLLSGWIRQRALLNYSPFSLPPQEPEARFHALEEARRLLHQEPYFWEVLRDAGRLATDFGQGAEAAMYLQRALEMTPKDAKLWNDLGAALQIGGQMGLAREAYVRSIELDPSELLPRFNLASLCVESGNLPEAKSILEAVIRDRPRAYIAHRRLAQILVMEGRPADAEKVLGAIPPDMRLPEDDELLRSGR